ncbi:MAG TPA: TonB-dependent receptor [Gemmatimonadales bacterium]|nr:TonB-dependent receptor [Gemmatimonadales bacterium]
MRPRSALALLGLVPLPLAAQAGGAIAGHVRDAVTGQPLAGVLVTVDSGARGALSAGGTYRIREVHSGWHRLQASALGYETAVRDSVRVESGLVVTVDFALQPQALTVAPVRVEARPDVVLDPLATATAQRISAEDLHQLPVSSLAEGLALTAGSVGESYRGGRPGEQAFVLDGLGVKNQLDASSGGLGVRLPPDLLEEATLVTNGFSARYGQAISGLVNVVTKDGGDRWRGRAAYETDRPLPDGWDYGLDRFVIEGDGPIGHGVRVLGVVDLSGRLDADPVAAPPSSDPRDPRSASPWLLPHNSGETYDAAAKVTIPLGQRETVRVFGLRSLEQQLLYDPAYKYDASLAPARRVSGTLASVSWQHVSGPATTRPLVLDLRLGYFTRDFLRGTLKDSVRYRVGAFTGQAFHIAGEDLARAQDTVGARAPIPGLLPPDYSIRTPWGVPAFFLGSGSRGEVAWNRLRELRGQLDVDFGLGPSADLYLGGVLVSQRVQTFERVLGSLPVGDTVPGAAAASFAPLSAAAYAETQLRASDLGFTFGLRYDQFDPRAVLQGGRLGARRSLSPRFAVSTVLKGATVVASWGRFSQAPDFQYLVDAAFDDTTRTGRFRRGNPDLGFETATQYEFSVRARPSAGTVLRVNAYVKRLEGLIASVPLGVNPDSAIFGNADFGSVRGAELVAEREFRDGWGVRASYTLQSATATATNAYQLFRRIRVDTITGDTIAPGSVEFPLDYDRRHSLTVILQARVPDSVRVPLHALLAGLEGAAIVRYASGLPFSRTNPAGDSLLGLPNSERLPSQASVDVLLRRPLTLFGRSGGVYLDVRNLLNRQNVVAVRRDTGEPGISQTTLQALAQQAYAAHPEPIPYESPRYRAWADLNHNGYVDGPAELMPLYLAAARDFTQPLFAYGPPRLVRLGMELVF